MADLPVDNTPQPSPPSPTDVNTGSGGNPFALARGLYDQLNAVAPAVTNAIFGAAKAQQEAGNVARDATLAGGQAGAQEVQLGAENTIATDNIHMQLLRAIGLDVNDPNSKLNQEINNAAEARKSKNLLRTQITDLQGKTLFSDPIGWVMAQPQLQKLIPQYNMQVDLENDAQEEVQRIETLATNVRTNVPAHAADLVRAQAQAQATRILETAKTQAAEISARNAAGYAKAMMDAFTLKENIFQRALGLTQAEESMQMRQVQMAQLAMQRTIMNEARAEKAQQNAEIRNQQELLVVGVNTARRMINGDTRDMSLEDIKKMSPQQREAWLGVLARGNFGNTYADSIPFIREFGNAAGAANAGNAGLVNTTLGIEARVQQRARLLQNQAAANPLGAKLGAKEALIQAYQDVYKEDYLASQRGTDKTDLPIQSPLSLNYNSILASTKNTPESFISKMLQEEAARSRTGALDNYTERMFLNAAKTRVLAGEVDPKTAAQQIYTFYALNANKNYVDNGLQYLGLPRMQDWIITPDAKVGGKKVDLMNPTQLENYFTSEIAASKRSKLGAFGDLLKNPAQGMFGLPGTLTNQGVDLLERATGGKK